MQSTFIAPEFWIHTKTSAMCWRHFMERLPHFKIESIPYAKHEVLGFVCYASFQAIMWNIRTEKSDCCYVYRNLALKDNAQQVYFIVLLMIASWALVWNLGMVFIYPFLEVIAALISTSYEY